MSDTPAPAQDATSVKAWLDESTRTRKHVWLQQRGDLVAVADELQRRLRIAEDTPAAHRKADQDVDALKAQLADIARTCGTSTLRVTLEARSERERDAVRYALPREDRRNEPEVTLHQLADAIVEPAGIDTEWLRTLRDRMLPQYQSLLVAAITAATALPDTLGRGGATW